MIKDRRCNACDRRDGDGYASDEDFYKIETVMDLTDVKPMVMEVMDTVVGSKLYYM